MACSFEDSTYLKFFLFLDLTDLNLKFQQIEDFYISPATFQIPVPQIVPQETLIFSLQFLFYT